MGTLTNLDLYLSHLDTQTQLNIDGTFSGVDAPSITGNDVTLYYGSPISEMAQTFKFYTDGGTNITDEGVYILVGQMSHFLANASSTKTYLDVTSLYQSSSSTTAVHDGNVITDISTRGNSDAPDAALHFLQKLSLSVFGTSQAVDLFTNEAEIAASFGTAVETCASSVSSHFSGDSNALRYDNIDSHGTKNQKVAKLIWDQLKYTHKQRFGLEYNANVDTGSVFDSTNCPVSGGPTQSGSPTVDVYVTSNTIDSIQVNTTGGGFSKGDTVTIQDTSSSSPNFKINITLNSVQAAILNGSLDDTTSGVEFPLEVNDTFNIKFTIQSSSSQVDLNGTNLDTAGTTATTVIKLVMKMIS